MIRFLFSVLLFISCSAVQAQVELKDANKKSAKLFEDSRVKYGMGDPEGAISKLKASLVLEPKFIDALATMAMIYHDIDDIDNALKYIFKTDALDPMFNRTFRLMAAEIYFSMADYDNAKIWADKYLELNPGKQVEKKKAEIMSKSCDFAKHALANPVPYEPKKLTEVINSQMAEYFPALTADNEYIYFTRSYLDRNSEEDIYYSRKVDDQWQQPKRLNDQINRKGTNEGAHTISPNGNYLIFTACGWYEGNSRSCDLFIAKKTGDIWGKPINLGPNINSAGWESQPSISSDGRTLYFVSKRKSGFGGADIYMSQINDEGVFGKAVNLGASINSQGSENRPFIHPDNNTLFFSSNGHIGLGDFDCYVSRRQPNGEWGEPENLGYPINSNLFDNGLFVSTDGKTAFYASDRNNKKGNADIYSFELPQKLRPEKTTYVKGKVYDEQTNQPLKALVELIDLETGTVVRSLTSDSENGSFLVTMVADKNYACNVAKSGYLFHSENFSLKENEKEIAYNLDIPLKKIKVGETVILNNIFFEFGKYDLKKESEFELDIIVDLMKENPEIIIEIMGHTDNVGSNEDNLTLSDNRARSVKEYIQSQGIESARLSSKGFGENKPIATNDTDEGRAKNRRTEFKITGFN